MGRCNQPTSKLLQSYWKSCN